MALPPRLNRPDYLFHPRSVIRRLRHGRGGTWDGRTTETVRLPWDLELTIFSDEIGRAIAYTGVFDMPLTETILRLTEPGDLALDVGANVGYVTSLMARRAGPTGRVIAFEPHPTIHPVLEENARRWHTDPSVAAVEARRLALSNESGAGHLHVEGVEGHMGLFALSDSANGDVGLEVELGRLDDLLAESPPQLLKIDVEGHERAVLEGGAGLLSEGRIRDVVFEEHAIYPAPSMTLLEEHGMTLFTLKHTLLGLHVHPIEEGPAPPEWPGPNYLATRDPDRAMRLLRPRGWRCLGGIALLGQPAA